MIDQILNVEIIDGKLPSEHYKGPELVSFVILRNPMYKYSKKAVDEFFESCPELAFLFGWWLRHRTFRNFCQKLFDQRKKTYTRTDQTRTVDFYFQNNEEYLAKINKLLNGSHLLHV